MANAECNICGAPFVIKFLRGNREKPQGKPLKLSRDLHLKFAEDQIDILHDQGRAVSPSLSRHVKNLSVA